MKGVFRSLKTRNYRLYFFGQVVSLIGTWMQIVANSWLVWKLTHNGLDVGLASAVQFGPMLIGSTWGGLIADRFPKRRILMLTQSLFMLQAAAMGTIVATGVARLWMVFTLIAFYGVVQVVDVPARQAFASEMVAKEDVMNAVGLNSAVFNGARMVGPAVAGFLIKFIGFAPAFYSNAASYLAVLGALYLMRERDLYSQEKTRPEGRGQIRAGFTYVRHSPILLLTLLMMTVVGTLALNFQIVMPLFAGITFHGDSATYGLLSLAQAGGAFVGAMFAATRKIPSIRLLVFTCLAFGLTMIAVAVSPTLAVAYVTLPLMGLAAMVFISTTNTMLQINSSPEMRGRVLALWSLVFLGSTPIGGPLVGWISQAFSPRWALAIGGIATAASAAVFGPFLLRLRTKHAVPIEEEAEALEVGVETVSAGQKT